MENPDFINILNMKVLYVREFSVASIHSYSYLRRIAILDESERVYWFAWREWDAYDVAWSKTDCDETRNEQSFENISRLTGIVCVSDMRVAQSRGSKLAILLEL